MESMNAEPYVDTTKSSLYKIPLLGRIHFVPEMAGMICCSITVLYWIYGVWCTYMVILLPHYADSQVKMHLLISKLQFIVRHGGTIHSMSNFLSVLWDGHVPI